MTGHADPPDVAASQEPRLRIGEVAKQIGVTPRTLRYWEEIGLLKPCADRGSGERRYSPAERERIAHIRELQGLLGLSLAEIQVVLASEDTLERARLAARADAPTPKRLRLLAEAIDANKKLVERITERLVRIGEFRDECVARGERMATRRDELESELASDAPRQLSPPGSRLA